MVRRLKNEVGRCCRCGSSAVYSWYGKYIDGKKHVSVVCCNKDCGVRTPGYNTESTALDAWNQQWQMKKKEGGIK